MRKIDRSLGMTKDTIDRVWNDRRGAVAVIFALLSPIMIGFVGLGIETGLWYMTQAKMQEVADTAAMAADRELSAGTGKILAAATRSAQLNNCTAANNCSIDPPTTFRTSASPTSDNGVQVVARTTVTPLFAGMFVQTNPNGTLSVTATGRAAFIPVTTASGGVAGCVLGLDTSAAYTVALNNNAVVSCNVMSNSKCLGKGSPTCSFDSTTYGNSGLAYNCDPSLDPQCNANSNTKSVSSLYLSNNAAINGTGAAGGVIYMNNNATITTPLPNATQATDPYAALTVSAPTATAAATVAGGNGSSASQAIDISIAANTCSTKAITYTNNVYVKLHPGCYNGVSFMNNANITLDPGTYYIKSGFTLQNNAVITGTNGTTLIFVGTSTGSYAINVGNNAILNISAPNSGTYKGIALMGDPNGAPTIVQTFSNNAVLNIAGAIYFRNQIIDMENNATGSGRLGCTQVIGRRVLLSNNANFGNNCAAYGTTDITIGQQVNKTPKFDTTY